MASRILPKDIYSYLSEKVLGQDEVLKQVSVSLYKHINGIKWGNILLIGNSGTGKTTLMNSILQFYRDHEELTQFQAMSVINANTLIKDDGEVNIYRIFSDLEAGIRNRLGTGITPKELKTHIENATVCLDEIDKISSKISGRTNVSGISIQQALLTILEGETLYIDTFFIQQEKKRAVRIPINTARMLFICGGAFEELYNQVYALVDSEKDGRKLKETFVWDDSKGLPERSIVFNLKDYMNIDDLFNYGMIPQFISRFSVINILDNLDRSVLKQILLNAVDSPYINARNYFKTFGIELSITDEALETIARQAESQTRIGARALREVFNKIITDLQFDPSGSGKIINRNNRQALEINKDLLAQHL